MITFSINPANTININIIAVLYDVAIAFITGYLVWFKTDEYVRRREEREAYKRGQQDYSRYLGRLCVLLRSFRGPSDQLMTLLLESIEDAPVRSTFHPYREDERLVFLEVRTVLEEVRSSLDGGKVSPDNLKVCADKLDGVRNVIVSMRLQQPKARWFHLFGKPVLASTQ